MRRCGRIKKRRRQWKEECAQLTWYPFSNTSVLDDAEEDEGLAKLLLCGCLTPFEDEEVEEEEE